MYKKYFILGFILIAVEEIVTPVDSNGNYTYTPGTAYGPDEQIWIYTAEKPSDLYSMLLSNAQHLSNGNTLICSSMQGLFFEVTPEKNVVWQYKNVLPTPWTNAVARIQRYPTDYPGIPETIVIDQKGKILNAFIIQTRICLQR